MGFCHEYRKYEATGSVLHAGAQIGCESTAIGILEAALYYRIRNISFLARHDLVKMVSNYEEAQAVVRIP